MKQIHLGSYSLVKHNDPWREYFGGISCGECDNEVPFRSEVYNEDETNNYLCVSCYEKLGGTNGQQI